MRLYKQTIQDFALYAGLELTDEAYENLISSAAMMSARMRAVRIVSASSVSKRDLEQRLVHKGEDPECAKAAVEWMCELNLLDDRSTADQIVRKCASKGYGIARARQALFEKQIPKDCWDDVLRDYPDQTEHIVDFISTKLPKKFDRKDVQKVTNALIQRGHSYSDVRSAMHQFTSMDETWEEE
jgi:regulatory protein